MIASGPDDPGQVVPAVDPAGVGRRAGVPQQQRAVTVRHKDQWEGDPQIRDAIRRAEQRLGGAGRVLVRPSGTEPALRVMVEGPDDGLVTELADALAGASPDQRLMNGQADESDAFELRCEALRQLHRVQKSPWRGFFGGRIALIPHQLYVARADGRVSPVSPETKTPFAVIVPWRTDGTFADTDAQVDRALSGITATAEPGALDVIVSIPRDEIIRGLRLLLTKGEMVVKPDRKSVV